MNKYDAIEYCFSTLDDLFIFYLNEGETKLENFNQQEIDFLQDYIKLIYEKSLKKEDWSSILDLLSKNFILEKCLKFIDSILYNQKIKEELFFDNDILSEEDVILIKIQLNKLKD